MHQALSDLLEQLNSQPDTVQFNQCIATIDALYDFTPTAFQNGEQSNAAGENNGSCKLFSFAQLHHLSAAQTLNCFGDYYRIDVQQHPAGHDHQNIRNFMRSGWNGIHFEGAALSAR